MFGRFMKALIGRIVHNTGYILSVKAFVKQRAINAILFNSEPKMAKNVPSSPYPSITSSVGSNSNEESKASLLRRKRNDRKNQKYRDS